MNWKSVKKCKTEEEINLIHIFHTYTKLALNQISNWQSAFANITNKIAKLPPLENPEIHTFLADTGAIIIELTRHAGM